MKRAPDRLPDCVNDATYGGAFCRRATDAATDAAGANDMLLLAPGSSPSSRRRHAAWSSSARYRQGQA